MAACNTTYLEQSKDEPQNAADIMRAADLRPRYPQPTGTVDTGGATPPKAFSFFGLPVPPPATSQPSGSRDVEALAPAPADPTQPSGSRNVEGGAGGYTLNFENAPVSQVAKSVLGDILGVGYVIDPRAQGSISLSSGRPVEKKDMLYVLESALSANNLVMVRNASGYRIAPANEGGVGAVDEARGSDSAEPGFGLTVIPLQYVSGATLSKLLEGFATRPGAIRTDPSGKLLIVVGTGSERQSAVDTVRSFDVDWLRGQSVGMYPVQNSTPEPIVGELEKIMDSGDSGLGHGLVKFQPVSRLNSILVVASKPEFLRAAARWIYRLDEPSTSSASVKVYKVRYGDAKQIAQLLQQIFVTNGGVSAESPTNEIAPGSGVKAMTAAQRLTGGVPGNSSGLGRLQWSWQFRWSRQFHWFRVLAQVKAGLREPPPRNSAGFRSRHSTLNSTRWARADLAGRSCPMSGSRPMYPITRCSSMRGPMNTSSSNGRSFSSTGRNCRSQST